MVTDRVLSQRMASPTDGMEFCLKRGILDLASHSYGVLMHPRGSVGDALRILTESDWVGVRHLSRQWGSHPAAWGDFHWSEPRTSPHCHLGTPNCTVQPRGSPRAYIGVYSASKKLLSENQNITLCVDARACKGMLLRSGAGG